MMHAGLTPSSQIECNRLENALSPKQWKYIDGKNNPADDASCGLSPKDLLLSSRWLRGPSFLWDHHYSWQNSDKSEPESLQPDDKEVRKASSFTTFTTTKEPSLKPSSTARILFKLVQSKTGGCCVLALPKERY